MNSENNLDKVKAFLFFVLTFFIMGQTAITFIVAAFLFIALMILCLFLWVLTGHDNELVRIILMYEFPGLFGPYK